MHGFFLEASSEKRKKDNMSCPHCQGRELIEGTLEGVSFQSLADVKKMFSSGVYGIRTIVCASCGRNIELSIDPETLCKILKKD